VSEEPVQPEVPRPADEDEYAEERATVIHVDRGEDIAGICGRVEMAPTYAVIIYAPAGNRSLATELGIRRLLRHAEESGKRVAIATSSVSLASRARQARIPVARRPEHIRWDAPGRIVVRVGGVTLLLPAIGRYLQVLAILLFAVVGVALLLTMGPSATVVVYPPVEVLEETVLVTASPNFEEIDPEQLRVPAAPASPHFEDMHPERLRLPAALVSTVRHITLAARTTGLVPVGVAPARVALTIVNPTGEAFEIPAGARVVAEPGGVEFALDEAVSVPPNGNASANATAVQLGTVGNVPAQAVRRFVDAEFSELLVTNESPAAGGANEDRPGVAEQDVLQLRQLAQALADAPRVRGYLVEDRPHDAVFLGTAEVEVELGDVTPPVGTPAEVVFLDVTVRVRALAVLSETLERLARDVLRLGRGEGEFIPGSISAEETGARQFDPESETVTTEIVIRGEFASGITASEVRDAVKGKRPETVPALLRDRYGIDESEVRLFPGFAPWLPRFDFRVSVEFQSPRELEANEQEANGDESGSEGSESADGG